MTLWLGIWVVFQTDSYKPHCWIRTLERTVCQICEQQDAFKDIA